MYDFNIPGTTKVAEFQTEATNGGQSQGEDGLPMYVFVNSHDRTQPDIPEVSIVQVDVFGVHVIGLSKSDAEKVRDALTQIVGAKDAETAA